MRYRFLLLLAGAAAMCGCGDPAPRQAPGAAARPIKTFTTESLGAINKNFAGMSTADDISNLAFREPGQIVKMNKASRKAPSSPRSIPASTCCKWRPTRLPI